jgi:hypothetical protein
MPKLSDRIGMEHVMALGAGTAALKNLAETEGVPALIQEQIQNMAEVHAEACQIIVQLVNEEIDAKRESK